jgi:DNA-directed RNA polymerase specialized sigma24 family protein
MSLDNFDELLKWLDPDPERAGEKFEKIRLRIIKLFSNRGSRRAGEIFDETVSRVCEKVTTVAPSYEGDPALYFYGVAKNVHSEFIREDLRRIPKQPEAADSEEVERRHRCLDICLGGLSPEKRSLILRFYECDGQERIENRKRLAEELGIDTRALSLRALRIRRELLPCMHDCLKESAP